MCFLARGIRQWDFKFVLSAGEWYGVLYWAINYKRKLCLKGVIVNIFLIFSLNKPSKKMVDKAQMMMEFGQGPIDDLEGVMEEVNELSEAMMPKPQITKPSRPLKKRKITFAEPSSNTIPRDNTENQNVPEEIEHDVQADQEEHNTKVSNI